MGGLRVADFEAKEMLAMTNAVRGLFVPAASLSHQSLSWPS